MNPAAAATERAVYIGVQVDKVHAKYLNELEIEDSVHE